MNSQLTDTIRDFPLNSSILMMAFNLTDTDTFDKFSFELLYSDDGVGWKIDSLHFLSLETKKLPKKIPADSFHTFRTTSRGKHKYWQMKSRGGFLGFSGLEDEISIYIFRL